MKLPDKKYDVVLMDPPWNYGGPLKASDARRHYPTMEDEALRNMDIPSILNDRAVVFMWVTCPRLDFAIDLGKKSWGLKFHGVSFVWVKTSFNGLPIRAKGIRPAITKPLVEMVLGFSNVPKGRPLPVSNEGVIQYCLQEIPFAQEETFLAQVREHSRKPEYIHKAIDLLYPSASKVELFARKTVPGWDVWGNQV